MVVGGGFIGVEMAENLIHRGIQTTLVEGFPQLLPPMDPEIVAPFQDALEANGCRLILGERVSKFTEGSADGRRVVEVHTEAGNSYAGELVILGLGVVPNSELAKEAGLDLGPRRGIRVKSNMQTLADPDIYAVGDVIEVTDWVTAEQVRRGGASGSPPSRSGSRCGAATSTARRWHCGWKATSPPGPPLTRCAPRVWMQEQMPLAGPANRQGRIAADHIGGREDVAFRGVQGTAVCGAFGYIAACTGASEKTLVRLGQKYRKVYLHPGHHVGYYPGAQPINIKLLYDPDSGKVLGGQVPCPRCCLCRAGPLWPPTTAPRKMTWTPTHTLASLGTVHHTALLDAPVCAWGRALLGCSCTAWSTKGSTFFRPLQACGKEGTEKRVDVISMAIQAGMTVFDLEESELCYSPQFGAAKDPVNMAGFISSNDLRGDAPIESWGEVLGEGSSEFESKDGSILLDVREKGEYENGHVKGSINIPLSVLRERMHELPKDVPIHVTCLVGQRGYYGTRALRCVWELGLEWRMR